MISITINRPPYPSPRPKFRTIIKKNPKTGKDIVLAHAYMPTEYMKEKEIISNFLKPMIPKDFKLITGAIEMDITFHMPIPKSLAKNTKVGQPHIKKPDVDNLLKTYKDVLEGLIYKNDSQVYKPNPLKIYSDNPRIEIKIKEVK